LRLCLADVIPRYNQACIVLKPFSEEMDLEKYFDIYDVSDTDFSEAMLGYSETEFDDIESVRVLKILTARFHTARKIFLCCLMALDAHGGKPDFLRWSNAVDEIRIVSTVTNEAELRLREILTEEESKQFIWTFTGYSLTFDRFPSPTNTKASTDSRARTMASPAAETKLLVLWNSRTPSKIACTP
jgi:Mysoin-binding motif of peroxisomes